MNILYVSQYFPPEKCASAARVSELAQHWANSGHRVTVLTGFPNHPTGVVDPTYRKRFRRLRSRERVVNGDVVRTWLWSLPNAQIWKRVICYLSFLISACVAGLFMERPEVVIATSPQLLVGLSRWFLARFFGVPLVLEIRDLWPESLFAVGAQNPRTGFYRPVGILARCARAADRRRRGKSKGGARDYSPRVEERELSASAGTRRGAGVHSSVR